MVAPNLLPAIRETIKQNEIGSGSPYALSFARLGKSGGSFGFMQGDTNVSPLARQTLTDVLTTAGASAVAVTRIITALHKPLPNGNPLNKADTALVATALDSASGRQIVDAMDAKLFQVVLDGVDSSIAAAAKRQLTIAPLAILYIAPWVNMSGPPSLLNQWLAGAPIHGLPAPPPPQVTSDQMEAYLQATAYFSAHPKNYVHYRECVAIGAKLLP